jgi:NADH-quinone oxidoreductase subunit G
MINIIINGITTQVKEGTTILDAAKKVGIHVPTLCHLDLHDFGIVNKVASCRICVVEVKGRPNLVPACAEEVYEGMEIITDSSKSLNARRGNLELLLSNHPFECLTCRKNLRCDLQSLAKELNIRDVTFPGEKKSYDLD